MVLQGWYIVRRGATMHQTWSLMLMSVANATEEVPTLQGTKFIYVDLVKIIFEWAGVFSLEGEWGFMNE